MSEEQKQPEPSGSGSYLDDLTAKKEESNKRTMEQIAKEREEMDKVPRFGFFSIPYPSTVGDQAYSRKKEFEHHQVVDRKVITEKRGIYTQPGKKGKGPDSYFEPIEPLSNAQIDELKRKRKEDEDNYLKIVKERKEKKGLTRFKPAGPQEVIGFYNSDEHIVPDGPLTKEPDKKRFIQDRKVITEKRGIYTNPTKLGTSLNPSDYFSFYNTDKELIDAMKRIGEEEKLQKEKERKNKKVFRKPFAPASLKKCDCFATDAETYGLDPSIEKQRLNEYREIKQKGRGKYEKPVIPGSVKHIKPFSPPKLISTGRDCLFNDDLYKMPKLSQSVGDTRTLKERLEYEKAHRKNPFTYNKLMSIGQFSPSMSSFTCNLKRDFPTICFH